MGVIVPAVEPRLKACVLALGGLDFQRSLPEVDTINFVSRVKQPVLMLNGRYDFFFPVESAQEPFFRMLGSRKDQKKHLLYDSGHNIPRNEAASTRRAPSGIGFWDMWLVKRLKGSALTDAARVMQKLLFSAQGVAIIALLV